MLRLGASDGSSTEVSGNVKEGDTLVTGERAATAGGGAPAGAGGGSRVP